ncbi:translesion error-prone DNA polymerase V autoproteolytic subunit [Marinomonas epiphytica]
MRVTYLGSAESQTFLSSHPIKIPLYIESVSAGFPSPAQDFIERNLDLNELCIQHPSATFFVRAQGDSMIDAGIFSDDILVVDRSLTARHGDIVIACLYGEMTVKSLELTPEVALRPKNKAYPAIPISEESGLEVFGVVTNIVRRVQQ